MTKGCPEFETTTTQRIASSTQTQFNKLEMENL